MSVWLAWRFLKWIALLTFCVGAFTAVTGEPAARRRAALWMVTPSFFVMYFAGYGLMKATNQTLATPFVSAAVLAGWLALAGVLGAARAPGGARWPAAAIAGGLIGALGVMVTRGEALPWVVVASAIAALVALVALPTPQATPSSEGVLAWFTWIARFEGASLVTLVAIAMPYRRLTGVPLDGGDGWIGWVHGVLVLIYLPALWHTARSLDWPLPRVLAAFVASMVPFGTFVFEAVALHTRPVSPAAR